MPQIVKRRVAGALTTILLVVSVLLCLYVVVQVLTMGYASFGGYSMFRVVTGSMEPTIPVGALTLTKEVDIDSVAVGDIICFRAKEEAIKGEMITHRVIGILQGGDGATLLQTQGDANPAMDGYLVSQANLVGKVLWNTGESSMLSGVVSFFSSSVGFLACIALPSLLIAGLILRECVGNIRGELKQALDELAKDDDKATPPETTEPSPTEDESLIGEDEYNEMYERIRAELIEELTKGGTEEQTKPQ